jgi:hypothetical protein
MTAGDLGFTNKFEDAMKGRLGQTGIFVEVGGKYYLNEQRLLEFEQRWGRGASSPDTKSSPQERPVNGSRILEFDALAFFAALDAQRLSRGLNWRQVADQIWELSSALNDRRHDHPISPSTIANMGKRGNISCQHALFFLRWLGRSPESFLHGGSSKGAPLPEVGPDRRLRWDLKLTYEALDARRREEKMTWPQLALVLGCTPSQLTGLKRARFATGMGLAMRITQWLGRPAADFVYAAVW